MEYRTPPPRLGKSIRIARDFFARCGALPLYEHGHEVLTRAVSVGMVEPQVIKKPHKRINRAWANSILAELILYHTVESGKLETSRVLLPEPLTRKDVREELKIFCELMALDRRSAPASDYVPLLNNGNAPLALLAMIADYAVTHRTEDRTLEFVHDPSPLFRYYSSLDAGQAALRMNARAGERIYAPIAELFGYPSLAGDILEHAYHVNHPEVYAAVLSWLGDESARSRLNATQALVRKLVRTLRVALKGMDIDAEVIVRLNKHPGKIMRKARRKIIERYGALDANADTPLEDFINQQISSFAFAQLNDLVAIKVITDRVQGRVVDRLNKEESSAEKVIKIIANAIEAQINALMVFLGGAHYSRKFIAKDNGYKADHIDVMPKRQSEFTNFEVQVKTREWDEVATHGKAAHYFYIGGESEFVAIVRDAYRDIIHMFNRNNKKGIRLH